MKKCGYPIVEPTVSCVCHKKKYIKRARFHQDEKETHHL